MKRGPMFLRWKVRGRRQTAYLVKSVRIDGKPRQQIIATLCTMQTEQGNAANAWVKFERKIQTLDLSEQEQAQVYRSFEEKVPCPTHEVIEQEKRNLAGWEAWAERLKANVVPNNPPMRIDGTTTEEKNGLAIKWTVRQPVPKAGISAQYTAFLVKQDGEQVKLGKIDKRDLNGDLVSYRHAFWYQVHSALCLAHVDYETYEKTFQMLDTWIELPAREDFIGIIQSRQRWAKNSVQYDLRAVHNRFKNLSKKEREIDDVNARGSKILTEMQRSGSNVSQ